jgi:hypothetical protein
MKNNFLAEIIVVFTLILIRISIMLYNQDLSPKKIYLLYLRHNYAKNASR